MRTAILFSILALVLAVSPSVFAQDETSEDEWAGPAFELENLDGDTVTEADVFSEGSVYLIDFWASWCRPCNQYLPHLKEMVEDYGDRGFKVVIFCVDDAGTISTARTMLTSGDYPFEILFDPEAKVQDFLAVRRIPTTVILDENGEELWRHVGYEAGAEDDVREQLESFLPEEEEEEE
jgi:thiol-disulfide isomerase/thioredoxin